MSDMKYGVSLQFKQALADLKKFKDQTKSFNSVQENNLQRQISLQRNLNTLRQQGNKPMKLPPQQPSRPNQPSPNNPRKPLGGMVGPEQPKALRQQQKSLQQARDTVERSVFMMKAFSKETTNAADKAQMITQAQIRTRIATAKTATEVRNIVAQEKAKLEFSKRSTAEMKKQNFLMQRMKNSSQQFAGNMVSAFAVAAGGAAVTRIGQEFEAVDNTMLAVSESSKQAGENFQFVKDEAFRLGLGLTESAKGFAKMVAARGDMSLIDTKAVFTGTAEMSTLLGLTADESNRATNAIQQMMSKGVVSAEELKLQLGEVMPNAIQLMAKAAQDAGLSVDGSVKSMMDLQMQGALLSEKVLPHFAKRLSDAARNNGGLEKAMDSNRVAMNRFMFAMQEASNDFFTSGFSEGLTEFFNESAQFIRDNGNLWKALGKILGSVLSGIAKLINLLSPVFDAFGTVLRTVTDLLGDFSGVMVGFGTLVTSVFLGKIPKATALMRPFVGGLKMIAATAMKTVAPFLLLIGALEEISEFFNPTGKKTLIGMNVKEFGARMSKNEDLTTKAIEDGNVSRYAVGRLSPQQQGFSYQTQPPININATLEVDGEAVASSVMKTNTAQQSMERTVHSYQTGNY